MVNFKIIPTLWLYFTSFSPMHNFNCIYLDMNKQKTSETKTVDCTQPQSQYIVFGVKILNRIYLLSKIRKGKRVLIIVSEKRRGKKTKISSILRIYYCDQFFSHFVPISHAYKQIFLTALDHTRRKSKKKEIFSFWCNQSKDSTSCCEIHNCIQ